MKKLLFIFLLALSLLSCEDDDTDPYEGKCGNRFLDYAIFRERMAAWTEPESYSFTYVDVSGGSASIRGESEIGDATRIKKFASISEIYEYFDALYNQEKDFTGDWIGNTYTVNYSALEGFSEYPETLTEREIYRNGGQVDGYGGVRIRVYDIKVN